MNYFCITNPLLIDLIMLRHNRFGASSQENAISITIFFRIFYFPTNRGILRETSRKWHFSVKTAADIERKMFEEDDKM